MADVQIVEARDTPISVEQEKLSQPLQRYIMALAKKFPFANDVVMDRRDVTMRLSALWPALPEWKEQANELLKTIDSIVQALPAKGPMPSVLLRISVNTAPLTPSSLPEPKGAAVLAMFNGVDGVMRRYVVPASEQVPSLDHTTIPAGLMVLCQSSPQIFNQFSDNRPVDFGAGTNMYSSRNRDKILMGDEAFADDQMPTSTSLPLTQQTVGLPPKPSITDAMAGEIAGEQMAQNLSMPAVPGGAAGSVEAGSVEERVALENAGERAAVAGAVGAAAGVTAGAATEADQNRLESGVAPEANAGQTTPAEAGGAEPGASGGISASEIIAERRLEHDRRASEEGIPVTVEERAGTEPAVEREELTELAAETVQAEAEVTSTAGATEEVAQLEAPTRPESSLPIEGSNAAVAEGATAISGQVSAEEQNVALPVLNALSQENNARTSTQGGGVASGAAAEASAASTASGEAGGEQSEAESDEEDVEAEDDEETIEDELGETEEEGPRAVSSAEADEPNEDEVEEPGEALGRSEPIENAFAHAQAEHVGNESVGSGAAEVRSESGGGAPEHEAQVEAAVDSGVRGAEGFAQRAEETSSIREPAYLHGTVQEERERFRAEREGRSEAAREQRSEIREGRAENEGGANPEEVRTSEPDRELSERSETQEVRSEHEQAEQNLEKAKDEVKQDAEKDEQQQPPRSEKSELENPSSSNSREGDALSLLHGASEVRRGGTLRGKMGKQYFIPYENTEQSERAADSQSVNVTANGMDLSGGEQPYFLPQSPLPDGLQSAEAGADIRFNAPSAGLFGMKSMTTVSRKQIQRARKTLRASATLSPSLQRKSGEWKSVKNKIKRLDAGKQSRQPAIKQARSFKGTGLDELTPKS